ncbi:hypothetical protein D041_0492B, partial [Vibrio parahaemolyticus EKP-008]
PSEQVAIGWPSDRHNRFIAVGIDVWLR